MTIEINRPETEALIRQCLQSERFHDIDELLARALDALEEKVQTEASKNPAKSLPDVFRAVRGLADDTDLGRNPSAGRPVEL